MSKPVATAVGTAFLLYNYIGQQQRFPEPEDQHDDSIDEQARGRKESPTEVIHAYGKGRVYDMLTHIPSGWGRAKA